MSDTNAPDFAAIAREVTGPWPQIVACWEAFRVGHGLRLRADVGDTDQQGFIAEALSAAYGKRSLGALAAVLEERKLTRPGFAAAVAPLVGTGFALQSHVNGVWRIQYASVGVSGLNNARRNICRISVDGAHKGTGVLIKSNLVATAAHVVQALVAADDGTAPAGPCSGRAAPGSLARLTVHFAIGEVEEDEDAPPIVAQLDEDWLAYWSGPAALEGQGAAIDCTTGIDANGPWDLAVIRLHAPPVPGRAGYDRIGGEPSDPAFGVHILHHPADALGAPMGLLWSIGEVRKSLGTPTALRWLHNANTDGGSSGAPCFDNNWNLVALHQAGPRRISDPGQINRAVPIRAWAPDIARWAASTAAVPFLTFIDDANGRRVPVIGRRDLQTALWRAMQAGAASAERVFVVGGDMAMGGTLTVPVVQALATLAGRSVTTLDMRNAQADDAAAFAQRVVGALAAHLAEAALAPSRLTSALRDLRNDVAPALLAELGALAAGRQTWLVLTAFDDAALPTSGPVLQLVELLVAGLTAVPGLQLVLTGWNGPVAGHFFEALAEPEPADIVDHVLTAVSPGGAKAPEPLRQILAGAVAMMLAAEPPGDRYARVVAVAERARAMVPAGRPA